MNPTYLSKVWKNAQSSKINLHVLTACTRHARPCVKMLFAFLDSMLVFHLCHDQKWLQVEWSSNHVRTYQSNTVHRNYFCHGLNWLNIGILIPSLIGNPYLVKLDIFPNFRGENSKNIWVATNLDFPSSATVWKSLQWIYTSLLLDWFFPSPRTRCNPCSIQFATVTRSLLDSSVAGLKKKTALLSIWPNYKSSPT